MSQPTVKQLMESGAHLGHIKAKWNPKTEPFIFGIRNNTHIIDLDKTIKNLEIAIKYMSDLVKDNKIILFVGTKKQVKDITCEVAKKIGMLYINDRWLGGTLTNFQTIQKRLDNFRNLEKQLQGDLKDLTKKEKGKLKEKLAKFEKSLGGIKDLYELPDALFVTDAVTENVAVLEAKKLNIPIISLVDTNVDPTIIDYPIPVNDDSRKAVTLIMEYIGDQLKIARLKANKKESFDKAQGKLKKSIKKPAKEDK